MSKTITLSDDDYEVLMSLSKELQLQPNHSQAFPYFWSASSIKYVESTEEEYDRVLVFDCDTCDQYTLSEYFDHVQEVHPKKCQLFLSNLDQYKNSTKDELQNVQYDPLYEDDWFDFIRASLYMYGTLLYESKVDTLDNNPSIFLSDVQEYIRRNPHHLGTKPHTFANTICRMDKMEQLMTILYQLNPQKDINVEAASFCSRHSVKETV